MRLAIVATALSWTLSAAAAEDARLHWVHGPGAEGCVSGDVLERALDEATHVAVAVDGLIERDGARGGFRVRFDVRDASRRTVGTRELYSAEQDCERLTPSLLLVVATLAELAVVDEAEQPVVIPAQVRDVEPPRASVSAPPSADWHVQPLAATGFAFGLSPEASLGFIVGAELRTPWLVSTVLRGMYWPAGQSNFERINGQPGGIDFQMFQTELAACLPVATPRDFRMVACWGATWLMRHTRLTGLPVRYPSVRGTLGVSAALALSYAVSARWNIQLSTSLMGFARRDSYVYADEAGDAQSVYRTNPLAGAVSLGIGAVL